MTRMWLLSVLVLLNALVPGIAFADNEIATGTPEVETATIRLSVETAGATLYDADIVVEACPIVPETATTSVNAKCALDQSGLAVLWSLFGDDYFLDSVEGQANDFGNSAFWNWWTDLEYGQTALNKHELTEGEHLLVALGVFPLKIESDTATPAEGVNATTTAYAFGFDDAFNPVWNAADAATFFYSNGATTTANADGTASLAVASLDPIDVYAEKDGFVRSDTITLIPRPARAAMTVRSGSDVAFNGIVNLASPSASAIELAPTNATSTFPIPARSVLASLMNVDTEQDSFSITDLQYFSSFGAFYVNCITITEELCGTWQYAVNGISPPIGMDGYSLADGDSVYVYFGSPRRVSLATTTVEAGAEFTATAEAYDPVTDTYGPAAGYTLGITQENPDDPFSPLVIATSTAGADGSALFSLAEAGVYGIGLVEDFFFPSTALTVIAASSTEETTGSEEEQDESQNGGGSSGGGGGGGGGNSGIEYAVFNASQALAFLSGTQRADGSFSNELLTDWVAVAYAASGVASPAKEKLASYLKTSMPISSVVTDYERHAMALMALNINPYNGAPADYITPIVNAFDGAQFGDPALVNDDIFALIPLLKTGYGASDVLISDGAAFIVSKQRANGSWENSVDVTAAAVQALAPLSSLSGVSGALASAKQYLHSTQQPDGGWGNNFSTSWALQAVIAYGDSPGEWAPNGILPGEYLALHQASDGGMGSPADAESTRVWSTSYAVPAVAGKTWLMVLHEFQKPAAAVESAGGGSGSGGGGAVLGASSSSSPEPGMPDVAGAEATTTLALPEKENAPDDPEPDTPTAEQIMGNRDAANDSPPVHSIQTIADAVPEPDPIVETPMTFGAENQLAGVAAANPDTWLSQFLSWILHIAAAPILFLMSIVP